MRKILTWLFLSGKRYLKRPAFLVILLLFPFCTLFFRQQEQQEQQGIPVAVCSEDQEESSLGAELVERLAAYRADLQEDPLFYFYVCSSRDQVIKDVETGAAECGYVFPEGLEEKLDARDYDGSILLYQSPSTVAAALSQETVFSLLIEAYDRELFLNYVETAEIFTFLPRPEGVEEAGKLYDEYHNNGSTFRFQYETHRRGSQVQEGEPSEAMLFPVRGLTAVFLLITGLYGAVTLGRDEEKGLFLRMPGIQSWLCRGADLAAPVLLAAASGLGALAISGNMGPWHREILLLALYGLAVTAFSIVLKSLVRREEILCCLIPFFIIGSLVCCPVLIDAGRWIPALNQIGRFFLPYYYLQWF